MSNEWPEFKPEAFPPLSPEQKRLEMEQHLSETAVFLPVFPEPSHEELLALRAGTWCLKVMGDIPDVSHLPSTAEKGHAYVHGRYLYIYLGDQWNRMEIPISAPYPSIPHPLDFGSAPWVAFEHQLAITTTNRVFPKMQDENQSQETPATEPTYERGQRPEIQHMDDADHVKVTGPDEEGSLGFTPNMENFQNTAQYVQVPLSKLYTRNDIDRVASRDTVGDVTFVTTVTGVSEDGKSADFQVAAHVNLIGFNNGAVEGTYVDGQVFTNDSKTVRRATEQETEYANAAIVAAKEEIRQRPPRFSLAEGNLSDASAVADLSDREVGSDQPREELPPAEVAPTGVKTINGVDVVPLGEVATPDGLKPFADGKIVGVFDQDENKPIHERMGLPDVFITEQLRVNGVANPEHWMRGMNRAVYESRETVEQKIYVVNQHLRLHVAEQDDEQSARMRHRMTIADVNAEDWYRIIAADVLPYLVERDKVKKKKEAEAKTA